MNPPRDLCNRALYCNETNISIEIIAAKNSGPPSRTPKAWLDIYQLEELSWASKIKKATLNSDHFENSENIYIIENSEELTVILDGESFDINDIVKFQRAIDDLDKLHRLTLYIDDEAEANILPYLKWPGKKNLISTSSKPQN